MVKAIFYKEWIKTRWYWLLSLIIMMGFSGYAMMRVARVCSLKGIDHMWIVMLQRDAIFVELLQFVPLFLGLLFALVQFVPEMHHKSFKLTLHLPIKASKALTAMIGFGGVLLLTVFLLSIVLMWAYLQTVMAHELWQHVILTTIPWYLAGLAAYLLTVWLTLEPTWKHRVINGVMALLLIRIYFLSPAPESYNSFLPLLAIVTMMYSMLSMLSLNHFRDGRQD